MVRDSLRRKATTIRSKTVGGSPSNLIGVLVAKVPYIGLISLELRGPLGVTVIVLLVALIIGIEYKESKSATAKRKT